MKTAIISGIVCFCIFLAVLSWGVFSVVRDVRAIRLQAQQDSAGGKKALAELGSKASGILEKVDGLVDHGNKILSKQAEREDEQLRFVHDIQSRTKEFVGAMGIAAGHSARSMEHLEKVTLPAVDGMVTQVKAAVETNSTDAVKLLQAGTRAIEDLDTLEKGPITQTVNAVRVNLAKPEIGESLDHIEGILSTFEDSNTLVNTKMHELFDPKHQTFWQAVASTSGRFLLPEIWQWWITKRLPPKVQTVP